jgi:hypothetical protein
VSVSAAVKIEVSEHYAVRLRDYFRRLGLLSERAGVGSVVVGFCRAPEGNPSRGDVAEYLASWVRVNAVRAELG